VSLHNGALTINRAQLTVSADNQFRVFSAPNPTLTYRIDGFAKDETAAVVSGAPVLTTTADASSAVGSYTITIAAGNLSADNYQFGFQTGTLQVTSAAATAALTSSQNPSIQGSNVTFSVSLTSVSPATAIPIGSIVFLNNGVSLGSPIPLSNGSASFSTTTLPTGSNTISVEYAGGGNFAGATNTLVQVVNPQAAPPGPLSIHLNADSTITLTFAGTPAAEYTIQATADLSAGGWSTLATATADTNGTVTYTDNQAPSFSKRFYRAGKP
jgi:hypothetical protein